MHEAHTPSKFKEAAERAQQAARRRDWSEALHWWDIARNVSPDRARAHAGSGQSLRELGRLDEAESVLSAAAERFPADSQIAISLAAVANARRDWPTAISRWESVRQQFPNNPSSYLGSLNALRGAARLDEAEALLPAAEATLAAADTGQADSMSRLLLAFAIAKIRLDWPAIRELAENIIARSATPTAHHFLELARACWNLEEVESAEHAAQRAVAIDPMLTEAMIILAWTATAKGDGEKAIDCYRRLAELKPNTARWSLKLVELLNWLGHVDEAVRELDVVCRRWPDDPMLRVFLKNFGPGAALARESASTTLRRNDDEPNEANPHVFALLANAAPPETEWKRPLIVASPDLEMQVAAVPGAKSAVLVFTGGADGVSMPLSVFDRYLAALDVTAVYLKDFSRLLFLNGIRSLGEDYRSTLGALRHQLDLLGITRLATVGNCDGAAAAIRYGIELGAEFIVAASPTTHVPEDPLPRHAQGRNFKRARIARNVAKDMTDLRAFLETRRHDARIELLYREEDEWERTHALRIADAPAVTLHPLRGDRHHAALHRSALSRDNVHSMLKQWLGDRPRAANG